MSNDQTPQDQTPQDQTLEHQAAPPLTGGFSLVEFSTRRRVTVAMMTLTLVLFGVIALGDLKVNLLPDLSYPTLTVRTEYTGAAPAEIETLITEPVEEAVGVVKNLRKLKFYEALLEPAGFCRIHRSTVVNLSQVRRYHRGKGGAVTLQDGTELSVASARKQALLEALG